MDIEKTIGLMSLEQKARLCTGASRWKTVAYEDLGISSLVMSDGPHGLRRIVDENADLQESEPATAFPTASLSAATWNRDLIRKMGEGLAEECIAQGVDVILGPGVNIKRSPLCGRNFEYFSEDPYLAGEMALAYINGVQSLGVGTSLKHFAVNNQETRRLVVDAKLSQRALHEIYLPAFEKAVKSAKPYTVMCSYNKINGSYGSEHQQLLSEILKDQWGFEGLVVSDWGAVHDQVASLRGGLDLQMPGPEESQVQRVIQAVKDGTLAEARLDDAVRRILKVLAKARETEKTGVTDADAMHQLAAQVAAEGMVLLKNDGLLPLENVGKVAVIGRTAVEPLYQGNGSSHINPSRLDLPLDKLRLATPGTEFSYAEGYPADESDAPGLIEEAAALAAKSDAALLFIGLPAYIESEGYDRTDLKLTTQQLALIEAVTAVQPKTTVILNNGAPIDMQGWLEHVPAVLESYMMGQAGAEALAGILFGQINPSGKLAETFPLRLEDTPSYLNFPGEGHEVWYGEGIYVGYRYYDDMEKDVLFPFGHGLSYTDFAYSDLTLSKSEFEDHEGLELSVTVRNIGERSGKEVVQIYVAPLSASVPRPPQELKGFEKVELAAGETKTVKIYLDERAFAFWHPLYKDWVRQSGDFEIRVGASSRDIRLTETVKMLSTQKLPCILNRESTIAEWEMDAYGGPFFRELKSMLIGSIGEDKIQDATLGIDYETMMQNDPLENILRNLPGMNIPDPGGMVDMLLAQVHERARAAQEKDG